MKRLRIAALWLTLTALSLALLAAAAWPLLAALR
jgi:hypothetical protein